MAEPKVKNTVNVRTTVYADCVADQILARANKERAIKKKGPLSKSKAIEVALENVSIKKLVEA